MRLSADVMYGLLSEKYRLNRFGKGIRAKELALPVFWERDMQAEPGGIYIARTGDLPNKPPEDCVIICCGTKPPLMWNMWPCEIIHITDIHDDLLGVFNETQRIVNRIVSWEMRMQQLAATGSHIKEMVEASIPIFENRITVTDYELRILAYCETDANHPEDGVYMSDRYERVPIANLMSVMTDSARDMRRRDPFFVEERGSKDSYCINLYLGDTYVGTCSLQEDTRPLQPLDLELFQLFAGYVREALTIQTRTIGNQIVTAKAIFDQLLHGYPVSRHDMDHALALVELSLGDRPIADFKWCCTVIQNSHRGKDLPEEYLCSTVQSILPNATVLVFDESLVAFCLIGNEDHRVDEICDPLEAYLADMGFRAGISRTFRDPFHAQSFYQQALCALETGLEHDPDRQWFLFGDYALPYMLERCCGDFDTRLIVPPELVRLYNCGPIGPEYVDTLRAYLDNDCNASKTSKVMYLHRSTLVQRLDKIRAFVNLDDPDRCLYLRMCLHLPDVEAALADMADI